MAATAISYSENLGNLGKLIYSGVKMAGSDIEEKIGELKREKFRHLVIAMAAEQVSVQVKIQTTAADIAGTINTLGGKLGPRWVSLLLTVASHGGEYVSQKADEIREKELKEAEKINEEIKRLRSGEGMVDEPQGETQEEKIAREAREAREKKRSELKRRRQEEVRQAIRDELEKGGGGRPFFSMPEFSRARLGHQIYSEEAAPMIIVESDPISGVSVYVSSLDWFLRVIKDTESIFNKYKKLIENIEGKSDIDDKLKATNELIQEMSEKEMERIRFSNSGFTEPKIGFVMSGLKPKTIYLVSVKMTLRTTKTSDKGNSVTVEYHFQKWFDGPTKSVRALIPTPSTPRLIAQYNEFEDPDYVHTRRPTVRSPYQRGARGSGVLAGTRSNIVGAMQLKPIRKRIERETEAKQPRNDPYLNAIINKGKRILNKYGRIEYEALFDRFKDKSGHEWHEREKKMEEKKKNVEKLKEIWEEKSKKSSTKLKERGKSKEDTEKAQILSKEADDARDAYLEELRSFENVKEGFYKGFRQELEKASLDLRKILVDKSKVITTRLVRRYKMPFGRDTNRERELTERLVEEELMNYAETLAERFATRGNTLAFKMQRGLENVSRGAETFGSTWNNFIYNIFAVIFGPWTWTSLFAILQFFFILTYIGPNTVYLWIFPIIGAAFTFILNFSDTFKPLDWLTHMASGAIIGYSSLLLLIALGALSWTFMDPFWFWIIWGIIGLLGIFQFYQTGGWRVVLQGGVVILLFAYLALGPYSAYYQQALDQVSAPVEIAYRAVSTALEDVWLLATNPTEWYAKQQLVNVRTEKAIDFPKGVEVTLLDALPPSVPAGQEFAVTAVIKNEGSLEAAATGIKVSAACNQWCTRPPEPEITQPTYSLCRNEDMFSRDELYCAESCAEGDRAESTNMIAENCVGACRNSAPNTITRSSNCLTKDIDEFLKIYEVVPRLERGESKTVTLRGFRANGETGRLGETRIATVLFNLSYTYKTSSSLLTSVIGNNEMERRIQNNENIFKNVLAYTKSSPARLSLNVGPQPLAAGSDGLLLVSISNSRDDGSVKLSAGTVIIINMSKVVGTNLHCDGGVTVSKPTDEYDVVRYTVPQDVIVLPYEYQSIFAFICNFDITRTSGIRTGLVTAEIPEYTFVLAKEKDIPVTPPIGITYDPYEKECNTCGDGATTIGELFSLCTRQKCHDLSTDKGKCWYQEYDGSLGFGELTEYASSSFSDICHSCGTKPSCDKFVHPTQCEGEDEACGLNCYWDWEDRRASTLEVGANFQGSHLDASDGVCKEKEAVKLGDCSNVNTDEYNTYRSAIARSIEFHGLRTYVENPEALVAAIISQESAWRADVTGDGGRSKGLMQIYISKHPECDAETIMDPEANIDCGVKILSDIARTKNINTPRVYQCKGVSYSGTDAILRWYNGWPSDCSGTPDYVPEVKQRYSNWIACFETQETCTRCQQKEQYWCTTETPSEKEGICQAELPCSNSIYLNYVLSCPGNAQTQPTTCSACITSNQVWCSTEVPHETNGLCQPSQPCGSAYPKYVEICPESHYTISCTSCTQRGQFWCSSAPPSETSGSCQTSASCEPANPHPVQDYRNCPAYTDPIPFA